ncbi:MAG: hypothetical protein A2Y76_03155 [Planctomycetes bacterium RBG_13_60_9]|nr:MAG: hypothetical protein A2Y76_03155 [Planctomycetes bacterium RBG_13_60_9]
MRIAEKIHQIEKSKGGNCYLVETAEGLALVDTGLPGNSDAILRRIEEIGRRREELKYIALTHADLDHFGSAADVRAATGAKIAIHHDDVGELTGRTPRRKLRGFVGLFFSVAARFFKIEPVEPDIILKDGDRIGGLLVIHTPGHTPGSISLFHEESGALFSGDALLCKLNGKFRLPREGIALDPDQARRSAEQIKAHGFKILLPGHGRPRIERPKA